MPTYQFEAVDASGKPSKGQIEADSAKAARALLRLQKLVPMSVEPLSGKDGKGTGLNREIWASAVLSSSDLTIWTRQLAGLVASGLQLERALAALVEENDKEKVRNLVTHLRSEVNAGSTFARALEQHPREFSDTYRAVVAAGEASGQLDTVLLKLADDLEAQQTLKSKMMAAALYPAFVAGFSFLIVILLMTYVVPQVAQAFTSTKQQLPILTVIVLAFSDFFRKYGVIVFVLGAALFFFWLRMMKKESFRLKWDTRMLDLPVVGKLIRYYHSSRFASTLALLAGAGVPILKALNTSAQTLSNAALKKDALEALDLVREGAPLGSALANHKRFPALIPMFARLGEQTGKLPEMLARVAQQLSSEVQRRSGNIATILELGLIVLMGVIVLVIVLAVMLPIIQLNQFVK